MPRFYDPTTTDPTIKVINWFSNLFVDKMKLLNEEQIEKYILRFNEEGYFKQYKNIDIVITNKCSFGHFLYDYINTHHKYYPVQYDGSQIIVCSNQIYNNVQLLQNLQREFELAELETNQSQLPDMAKYMISCKKSYNIYKIEAEKKKQMAQLCAKILMRHRGKNEDQQPYDLWIRTVEKQIKENKHYLDI